jgi:hypothetical protein
MQKDEAYLLEVLRRIEPPRHQDRHVQKRERMREESGVERQMLILSSELGVLGVLAVKIPPSSC